MIMTVEDGTFFDTDTATDEFNYAGTATTRYRRIFYVAVEGDEGKFFQEIMKVPECIGGAQLRKISLAKAAKLAAEFGNTLEDLPEEIQDYINANMA